MSSQPKPNDSDEISTLQWIYWLGATLLGALAAMVFLYSTFQTKLEASENKTDLDRRLQRIEGKVDELLTRSMSR